MADSFLPKSESLKGGILFKSPGVKKVSTGPRNPKTNLNALTRGIIKSKMPKKVKQPKLPNTSQSMSLPGLPGAPTPSPIKTGATPFPKLKNPLPKAKLAKTKKAKAKKLAKGMIAIKPIQIPDTRNSPLTFSP